MNSPYRSIWFNPRQTFEELANSKDAQSLILAPFLVVGTMTGFDFALMDGAELDTGEGLGILFTAIVMANGLLYLLLGFLFPGMIKIVGKIWRGGATLTQLTNVISISFIPYCLILFYQLGLMLFVRQANLDLINGGIQYIIGLWTFSLLIIGVAKVQKFSYGFALLNILICQLPFLVVKLVLIN